MFDSTSVLAAAKQQAQYLKKALGGPLNVAQSLVAESNRFRDWHELTTILSSHPDDARLGAMAVTHRAGPPVRTRGNVSAALENLERFKSATRHPDATHLWFASRGFSNEATCVPRFHLDFEVSGSALAPGRRRPATTLPSRVQLNLWDIPSRLLFVSGRAGSGKTVLTAMIAAAHVAAGGRVEVVSPVQGSLRDWPDHRGEAGMISVDPNGDRVRVSTEIAALSGDLAPNSLVIVDEWILAASQIPGGHARAVAAIQKAALAGHAVIVVTQAPPIELWPWALRGDNPAIPLPASAITVSAATQAFELEPKSAVNQVLTKIPVGENATGARSFAFLGASLSASDSPLLANQLAAAAAVPLISVPRWPGG